MTVVIRWLGHAGFQIRSGENVVYVDYYRPKKLEDRLLAPTEKATLVLVTHSHADHCDLDAISSVTQRTTVIAAPADCEKKIGKKMVSAKVGDVITAKGTSVRVVQAYNLKRFRTPGNPYHPKDFGVAYLIELGGRTVYHAGDTDLIPEMSGLGRIDVALLPVGDTYTMDNAEASEAVKMLKPRFAIPMHTWDKGVDEFRQKSEDKSETKVIVLKEGEEFTLE